MFFLSLFRKTASEIKVPPGWLPLEALGDNPLHDSLLASGDCWAVLSPPLDYSYVAVISAVVITDLLPFASLCVCPFLKRTPVDRFRAHHNPVGPHVN